MPSSSREEQFLSLINQHMGILYRVSRAYCRDAEDRKDLVQDITAQLWLSFDRYNSQYRWSTWMYRIALNVAIGFYRQEQRRTKSLHTLSNEPMGMLVMQGEEEVNVDIARLYDFIDGLKRLDKALMLLTLDNTSHREIADILGITETNVGTRVHRIKTRLKHAFSNTDRSQHGT